MTEATQILHPSPTNTSSCPDCRKLLAFAELDELIALGVASPGQMTQHDELARELSGDKANGEAVAAVLARQLAEERHSVQFTAAFAEFESLRKDPTLAVLPSGRKVSLGNVLDFERWGSDSATIRYGNGQLVSLENAADIAAIDAALTNIGVYANAPTIAGEDRDGDGRTGE